MRTARYCLVVLCIGVTCLLAQEAPAAAVRPRLADGTLVVGSQRLAIRGVSYSNAAIGERGGAVYDGQPCRFARDLPVIAAMGANTIRTRALVPEDDAVFLSVLGTTGLYWISPALRFPWTLICDKENQDVQHETLGFRARARSPEGD